MANYVISEAERCLNCKRAFCQEGCPISTPIPEVIQLFKQNKLNEAGQMLFDNNPLSIVCSLICDHANQCEGHCIQGKRNSAIHFGEIENYISDTYFDKMKIECKPSNGKMVAVIGSGPAGITVAILMAKEGYQVTIFESRDKIGGVMQYGIPEFRLPKTILERYRKKLVELGVKIRPNTTIGGALEIHNLLEDGYSAIFIGTGVWRPKKLNVKGESLGNVHFGLDYLTNPQSFHLGETISIIGSGNTAMDVARTALRNGAKEVTIYAHNNRLSAREEEIEYARLDGANFEYDLETVELTLKGPIFKKAIRDEEGNKVGYEDELIKVYSDSTIICVSQGPKNKLILTTPGLKGGDKGLLITNDESGMTTVEGLFAAGDVVSGAKTIVQAVAEAKQVAKAMDEYIKSKEE